MVDSYVNYADCLMTTIQHHGLASLYSGGLARLAWVVPFTAIYLPTYDFLKQQLLQRHVASLQEQHEAAAARTTFATSVTTSPLETI
jgi:Mitochondrial carrier protein